MNKKIITIGAVILGIVFIALAVIYWITPAGQLPWFIPGFEAEVMRPHIKHGIASLLLGLVLLAFAWFKSGSTSTPATPGATPLR